MSNPNAVPYPAGPQQGYAPQPPGYSAVPQQYPSPGQQQYPPTAGFAPQQPPPMGQYYNPNDQGIDLISDKIYCLLIYIFEKLIPT